MKVLIQDADTGWYLGENGKWNAKPAGARDFGLIASACSVADHLNVAAFKILACFQNLDHPMVVRTDIVHPAPSGCGPCPARLHCESL
jgi:hypothetical protein